MMPFSIIFGDFGKKWSWRHQFFWVWDYSVAAELLKILRQRTEGERERKTNQSTTSPKPQMTNDK
jgi:hypothetical protein